MGAWGNGIEENDIVLDVAGTFVDTLRATQSLAKATAAVRKEFRRSKPDPERDAQVNLGLALSQWRYGALGPTLLKAVRADAKAGRGIDGYEDAQARGRIVRAFLDKIAAPNPRPRALPKPPKPAKAARRVPKPKVAPFALGECLAIFKARRGHHAAFVLAVDERDGSNLLVRIAWTAARAPKRADFAPFAGAGPSLARSREVLEIAHITRLPGAAVQLKSLGRIEVDPARYGLKRSKEFWDLVKPPRGIAVFGWDALTEPPLI